MNIYIDGENLEAKIEKNDSLDSIIATVEKIVSENSRVIYEIRINGELLAKVNELNINEINDLEFFTKRPKILILEAMQDSLDYIEKLKEGIDRLIGLLVNEEEKVAMELVVEIINGLEWIHNILNSIEQTTNLNYIDIGFQDCYDRFKDTVAELLEALENSDMIMLSDLFEFEILEILDEMMDNFPKIYDIVLEEEKQEINSA